MSNYYDTSMTVWRFNPDNVEDLMKYIDDVGGDLAYAFDSSEPEVCDASIEFYGVNPVNWGVTRDEMKQLSEHFPTAQFMLWQRDECGNESRSYWVGGRVAVYEPEIVWPEFDEQDLTEA